MSYKDFLLKMTREPCAQIGLVSTVKFLNFWTQKIPQIQTTRPNFKVFLQKDANGIANSEDPDQTAPLSVLNIIIIIFISTQVVS